MKPFELSEIRLDSCLLGYVTGVTCLVSMKPNTHMNAVCPRESKKIQDFNFEIKGFDKPQDIVILKNQEACLHSPEGREKSTNTGQVCESP